MRGTGGQGVYCDTIAGVGWPIGTVAQPRSANCQPAHDNLLGGQPLPLCFRRSPFWPRRFHFTPEYLCPIHTKPTNGGKEETGYNRAANRVVAATDPQKDTDTKNQFVLFATPLVFLIYGE
jgi:hypothetical protein